MRCNAKYQEFKTKAGKEPVLRCIDDVRGKFCQRIMVMDPQFDEPCSETTLAGWGYRAHRQYAEYGAVFQRHCGFYFKQDPVNSRKLRFPAQ